LAYDTIRAAVPFGNYITATHTMKHLRTEYFIGNGVSDKGSRNQWIETGSRSTRERAVHIAKKILQVPLEAAIEPGIEKQIRKDFKIHLDV